MSANALFVEKMCNGNQMQLLLSESSVLNPVQEELLKLPIAPLGTWEHPQYGTVSFTQQDFDDAISNWNNRVLGYEPPLFLGHPTNIDSIESAPSVAYLADIRQEGDTLFAYYKPSQPDTFEQAPAGGVNVKGVGYFRYSSAEVVRNAKSKADGQPIGTVYVGNALTNRPFIPNLPKPQIVSRMAFSSNDTAVSVVYDSLALATKQPQSEQRTQSTQDVSSSAQLNNDQADSLTTLNQDMTTQDQSTQPQLSEEILARFTQLSELVTTQSQQIKDLTSQLGGYQSRVQELENTAVTSSINNLNLPAAIRDTFSELIASGNIPKEKQQEVISKLQQFSQSNAAALTTTQGEPEQSAAADANAPAGEAAPVVNVYSDIIERNNKIAQERQKQALVQTV